VIVTPEGKGIATKSDALSALLLDSYNEGKEESSKEIELLSNKLKDAWKLLSSILTGMLISDPRWKEAESWLNDNRP
jgi:hypothetical protein